MADELLADKILYWLSTDPTQYSAPDKWPAVTVKIFFLALPFIFGLLVIAPFIWIWFKKKRKFTLKNIGIAILQSIGLVILGLLALFLLAMFLQGLAFRALQGA